MKSTTSMNLVLRDNEQLRAEVDDLTRRIRLARAKLKPLADDDEVYLVNVAQAVLDLRKPLSRRTNSKACKESSVVAWGAHLLSRRTKRPR